VPGQTPPAASFFGICAYSTQNSAMLTQFQLISHQRRDGSLFPIDNNWHKLERQTLIFAYSKKNMPCSSIHKTTAYLGETSPVASNAQNSVSKQ
jgi:hypothetical protein